MGVLVVMVRGGALYAGEHKSYHRLNWSSKIRFLLFCMDIFLRTIEDGRGEGIDEAFI